MCNAANRKFHMLVECNRSKDLWIEFENWIRALGMVNYYMTNRKKIIDDLVKSGQINIIILNIKKTIMHICIYLFLHLRLSITDVIMA